MRRRATVILMIVALGASGLSAAGATNSRQWDDHTAPFEFLFENHIDSHQQSMVRNGMLTGFFYIRFTGETDAASGLGVAKHGNCAEVDCEVGWVWHGVPWTAEYCGHEEGDHPAWAIQGADKYLKRGYSHFHWLNISDHASGLTVGESYDGYLLRLTAIDSFFFDHHGGFLITPGIETGSHANLLTACPTPS